MSNQQLEDRIVLVTGAARRIGSRMALACARTGADVILHYNDSEQEAATVRDEIIKMGRRAWLIPADFNNPQEASEVMARASQFGSVYALVNSAAIFEPLSLEETKLAVWERHLAINLTAPFVLSQAFAAQVPPNSEGRIVNMLDWRALRPGADHFAYSVSKAALAGLTRALAAALAPRITVNGLALGAILPPADQPASPDILRSVPAGRWGDLSEVEEALLFLLAGPAYVTGEIIHVDGGRHLI